MFVRFGSPVGDRDYWPPAVACDRDLVQLLICTTEIVRDFFGCALLSNLRLTKVTDTLRHAFLSYFTSLHCLICMQKWHLLSLFSS